MGDLVGGGGGRQRTQIACALAQESEILLLDEPTNHLDINHQLSILSLIASLPVTTVIALHDLNQAMTCNRLVMMHDGRLVCHGAPGEVLTRDRLLAVFSVDARFLSDTTDDSPVIRFQRAV